jgi:hypothetical protein
MHTDAQKKFFHPSDQKLMTVIVFITGKDLPLKYRNIANNDGRINSFIKFVSGKFGTVHHINCYDKITGQFLFQKKCD